MLLGWEGMRALLPPGYAAILYRNSASLLLGSYRAALLIQGEEKAGMPRWRRERPPSLTLCRHEKQQR